MLAIIDYDAGNIKSVEKALRYLGQEAVITRDPETILHAEGVILPGVGAFGDAMEKLHAYGLLEVIRRKELLSWESVSACSFCLRAVRKVRGWTDYIFWTEKSCVFRPDRG